MVKSESSSRRRECVSSMAIMMLFLPTVVGNKHPLDAENGVARPSITQAQLMAKIASDRKARIKHRGGSNRHGKRKLEDPEDSDDSGSDDDSGGSVGAGPKGVSYDNCRNGVIFLTYFLLL